MCPVHVRSNQVLFVLTKFCFVVSYGAALSCGQTEGSRFRTEARAAGHSKTHILSREEREEAELEEMKKVGVLAYSVCARVCWVCLCLRLKLWLTILV